MCSLSIPSGIHAEDTIAMAITPESAFTFDTTTNTIKDYNEVSGSDVVIPDTIGGVEVLNIGDIAFSRKNLKSVVLPDAVKIIGDAAFLFNQDLKMIKIGANVEKIGEQAFANCGLELIDFSKADKLKSIGDYAFFVQ